MGQSPTSSRSRQRMAYFLQNAHKYARVRAEAQPSSTAVTAIRRTRSAGFVAGPSVSRDKLLIPGRIVGWAAATTPQGRAAGINPSRLSVASLKLGASVHRW